MHKKACIWENKMGSQRKGEGWMTSKPTGFGPEQEQSEHLNLSNLIPTPIDKKFFLPHPL